MIFGVTIRPMIMLVSGVVVLVVLAFQFLQGKRIIKFKGALHRKVHTKVAGALVAVAVIHGLIGLVWWLSLQIG